MRIAFRICVDTLSAAQDTLPKLLAMLSEHQVKASFALSLGSPGQSQGALKGLLYRYISAQQSIAEAATDNLLAIKAEGHELGIAAYDPIGWDDNASNATEHWTRQQCEKAVVAFESLFNASPVFHAATNWQLNPHLLALEEQYKLKFSSDTRGKTIFYPQLQKVFSSCPQLPTTLPTITEVLERPEVSEANAHEFILAESQRIYPHGEVFSFNAVSDHLAILEKLIVMWKGLQWDFMTMGDLLDSNNPDTIRTHQIGWGRVPDNVDDLAMQSLPIDTD